MKIQVEFDSLEEFETFRTSGKKTRTKKEEETDNAGNVPGPLAPPTGGQGFGMGGAGFAPQAGGAGPMGGAFPVAAVTGPAPEVLALLNSIVAKVEAAVQAGVTKPDDMVTWFRGQIGPEAANATWDQIKTLMAKMQVPQLQGFAKLVGA